eukprot:TRINITY_DN2385_c0_g1_i2.p2 TRINITY_DN2385_c0_g1~~TRINITY_DN2385_c0_g1_i2.p2  ORF type:complete len:103 (-),score=8.02 TRINITY_DN2385_c0_g1_i2:33-341(-)
MRTPHKKNRNKSVARQLPEDFLDTKAKKRTPIFVSFLKRRHDELRRCEERQKKIQPQHTESLSQRFRRLIPYNNYCPICNKKNSAYASLLEGSLPPDQPSVN